VSVNGFPSAKFFLLAQASSYATEYSQRCWSKRRSANTKSSYA